MPVVTGAKGNPLVTTYSGVPIDVVEVGHAKTAPLVVSAVRLMVSAAAAIKMGARMCVPLSTNGVDDADSSRFGPSICDEAQLQCVGEPVGCLCALPGQQC